MSRFYGDIQGGRGQATRCGTISSGISSHPRGWNLGVKVDGYSVMADAGKDEFDVRVTGGSNNPHSFPVVNVRENADGTREVRYFLPDGDLLRILTVKPDGSYEEAVA